MKRKVVFFIFCFLLLNKYSHSQSLFEYTKGSISFNNATNVYVRFVSTESISIGDTLYIENAGKYSPYLLVTAKSSISCVTTPIGKILINKDLAVFSKKTISVSTPLEIKKENIPQVIAPKEEIKKEVKISKPRQENDQYVRGRITTGINSNISNLNNLRNTSVYGRFQLDVNHINNSKWSLNSYINYRENFINRELPAGYQTKFFRIYDLSLKYEPTTKFAIIIGRKINNNLSSIGAIDGVQSEYKFRRFFVGGLLGSRPDLTNYSLNTSLFQAGAYVGFRTNHELNYSETIFGVIEQTNKFITDRRYIYVQHTNRLSDKINMFGSLEMDLYQNRNGVKSVSPRTTAIFYSLTYQQSKKLSLIGSYDSRRNIIYYETFLFTDIDRLLSDDVNRQGLRFRVNYKLTKNLTSGISFSNRFQTNGAYSSSNYNGYMYYYNVPIIGGNVNIDGNINSSDYLNSKLLSIRYAKDVFNQKLYLSTYYRIISYAYRNEGIPVELQKDFGIDASYSRGKLYTFHVMSEYSTRGTEKNYRTNFSISRRIQ